MPGMRRREFVSLFGGAAAAWPLAARAQQAGKLPTIGFWFATSSTWKRVGRCFRAAATRAWLGRRRTIAIEYRWAEGRSERFAEIVAEFVRLNVDVIVTGASPFLQQTRYLGHPDCIRAGAGPDWQRIGRFSGATGRQCHWLIQSVGRSGRQETRDIREIIPGLRR